MKAVNTRLILITSIIILVLIIGFFVYKNKLNKKSLIDKPLSGLSCQDLEIESVKLLAKEIDDSMGNYKKTSVDLMGQSTEGGVQNDHSLNNHKVLVTQTFYGETGFVEISYYFTDDKIFYIEKIDYGYEFPIYVDSSRVIDSIDSSEYFLDKDQNLCLEYFNQNPKSINEDSKRIIKNYISQLSTLNNDQIINEPTTKQAITNLCPDRFDNPQKFESQVSSAKTCEEATAVALENDCRAGSTLDLYPDSIAANICRKEISEGSISPALSAKLVEELNICG